MRKIPLLFLSNSLCHLCIALIMIFKILIKTTRKEFLRF